MPEPLLSQLRDFRPAGVSGGIERYHAVRRSTGLEATVYVLPSTVNPTAAVQRLTDLLSAMAAVRGHPNIVHPVQVLRVDEIVHLVVEFDGEESLADRIARRGQALDSPTVVKVAGLSAVGLAAAHQYGIVHGDLRPEHLLFGTAGTAKVSGFGLALAGDRPPYRDGHVVAAYGSPEEMRGERPSIASDVYSFGATLLHAAAGRSIDASERAVASGGVLLGVSEPLRGVIERCLRLDPAQRPTAAQLVSALDGRSVSGPIRSSLVGTEPQPAAFGAPLSPVPTGPPIAPGVDPFAGLVRTPSIDAPVAPPPSTPPKRRGLLVALGVGAVVVLAGLGWFLLKGDGDSAGAAPSTTDVPATVAPVTVATTLPPVTTVAPTTAPPTTAPETTVAVETTVPPPPTNPQGDVVGEVPSGRTTAGLFATIVQQAGDPAPVSVQYSDAYFYAVWSELTKRTRTDTLATTTPNGYLLQLQEGQAEISGFVPAEGLLTSFVETTAEGSTDIGEGVLSSGICLPPPDGCTAGLATGPFAPEVNGDPARLFNLAKVTLAPTKNTYLMYLDGASTGIASVGADYGVANFDNDSNLVSVTFGKNPEAGTKLTLIITLVDMRTLVFTFDVD